jgi:hypothetical protein
MRNRLLFLLPPLALLLAACAGNPYQPYAGGVGYSEVGTARNRYEVVYHGTGGMDEATAKNYAIIRAAEVGKQNGMRRFRIAGSRNDAIREIVRDPNLFPRTPWSADPHRMTEWEWRREQELEASRARSTVRESRAPVIRLIVDYTNEDCDACLTVEDKLREATEKGILKKGGNEK